MIGPDGASTNRIVDPGATSGQRTYATLVHLSLLLIHVVPVPVVPALVMWLVRREESPFLDDHGREVVNFQLTLVVYVVLAVILGFAVCGVGLIVTGPAVYLYAIISMILGAVAAHEGRYFRYPACIRFIA